MIWAFLVLFAAPAHVLSASDTDLKNEVEQRLAKEEDVARKVDVTVRGSEVTLSGTVKTLWQKEWAIDRAEDTKGVESVVSNLAVMDPDSQEELAEAVARAINRYPYYTVFDWAEIHVEDAVVTISGEVTSSPDKPGDIRDRVSRVPGVKAIVNEIEVLSPARGDQRIRSDLARRLFGSVVVQPLSECAAPRAHHGQERVCHAPRYGPRRRGQDPSRTASRAGPLA